MSSLVSVIIPIRDGERYLGAALDSVAAQDYAEFEVIVIDDGSVDGGPDLARSRGLKVIETGGRGVAFARNAGIRASRGTYLAFLDQDDVWLPAKTTRQVAVLRAQPHSVCFVRQKFFVEPGHTLPSWFRPELLREHDGYSPSCFFMTRETFERVGPFDEELTKAGDLDWIARARLMGHDLVVVPEVLVERRLHDQNDSASPNAMEQMLLAMRNAAARQRASRGEGKE